MKFAVKTQKFELKFDFLFAILDTSEEGAIIISEEGDPILTFRVIKMFAKRTLIIPRHKPAIVIRKNIFIYESGTKESAIMASLIVFLCLLGGYLFR